MKPETPKQSEAPRENNGDVHALIKKARDTIGSYEQSVQEDEKWSEAASTKRMQQLNQKLASHGTITLLEVYNSNADAHRRQAVRLQAKAEKSGKPLTPQESREAMTSQMSVAMLEVFAKATNSYLDLLEVYGQMKAKGLRGEAAEEELVFQHLAKVTELGKKRTDLLILIEAKQIDPLAARKQAIALDRELQRLLLCQDKDIPGANKDGLLPVFRLMLGMQKSEYEELIKDHAQLAKLGFAKIRTQVEAATKDIKELFPGKEGKDIPENDPTLLAILKKHGYETPKDYFDALSALKRDKLKFDTIKAEMKENTNRLADITDKMGRYQTWRAQVATMRHLLDQGYSLLLTEAQPYPGESDEDVVKDLRSWLNSQRDGAITSLERHLDRVDSGVLKVGLAEVGEQVWNERARPYMARLAESVATIETCWIPDVPGLGRDFWRNEAKKYLLGGLHDAMDWPRGDDGQPIPWEQLSEGEREQLRKKQTSIKTAIETFRDTQALEKLRNSVGAARALVSDEKLQAERFAQPGEIDVSDMKAKKIVVTPDNIPALVREYGAPKVYKLCFEQLEGDWNTYSKEYKALLQEFNEVIGVHLDMHRYFLEFGDKQADIAWLLVLLGAAGGVVSTVGGYVLLRGGKYALVKTAEGGWKLTKMGAEGAGKLLGRAWNAARTGASAAKPGAGGAAGGGAGGAGSAGAAAETGATSTASNAAQAGKEVVKTGSRLSRILGHGAFIASEILITKEIYDHIRFNMGVQPITNERERVKAALEYCNDFNSPVAKAENQVQIIKALERRLELLDRLAPLEQPISSPTAPSFNVPAASSEDPLAELFTELQDTERELQKQCETLRTQGRKLEQRRVAISQPIVQEKQKWAEATPIAELFVKHPDRAGYGVLATSTPEHMYKGGTIDAAIKESDAKVKELGLRPSTRSSSAELFTPERRYALEAQEYLDTLAQYEGKAAMLRSLSRGIQILRAAKPTKENVQGDTLSYEFSGEGESAQFRFEGGWQWKANWESEWQPVGQQEFDVKGPKLTATQRSQRQRWNTLARDLSAARNPEKGQAIYDPIPVDFKQKESDIRMLSDTLYLQLPLGSQWIAINNQGKPSSVIGHNEGGICSLGHGYRSIHVWAPNKTPQKDPPSTILHIQE